MNFLNEVAGRFRDAISFAAGRPTEKYFEIEDVERCLARFREHLEVSKGLDPSQVRRLLLQYGRTKGIVHDLIATNLAVDEGVVVDPEAVVVTVGCQEAMFLVLRALRADERDVVLAVSPTYVGIAGAAQLVDMPLRPVRSGAGGIDLDHLADQVRGARAAGRRPRAVYVVPDFANPTGTSMDVRTRRALLRLAEELDFLVLEDNPYGLFGDHDERPPTLKGLDENTRVVYLGSLAKTCFPGARIGYVVADQPVSGGGVLADELSKIKSMTTVNTSPLAQAVVGGKLLQHDYSLVAATKRESDVYRRNRRLLLDGLAERFPGGELSWNTPAGGFFVVVDVPFVADDQALERSAGGHRVLWTPMSHFYRGSGGEHQLRLSCSALAPGQIEEGLNRFRAFAGEQIRESGVVR
nr:PLP-dependent aminotransferase family protein [Lentzea xinjiangensis]